MPTVGCCWSTMDHQQATDNDSYKLDSKYASLRRNPIWISGLHDFVSVSFILPER